MYLEINRVPEETPTVAVGSKLHQFEFQGILTSKVLNQVSPRHVYRKTVLTMHRGSTQNSAGPGYHPCLFHSGT